MCLKKHSVSSQGVFNYYLVSSQCVFGNMSMCCRQNAVTYQCIFRHLISKYHFNVSSDSTPYHSNGFSQCSQYHTNVSSDITRYSESTQYHANVNVYSDRTRNHVSNIAQFKTAYPKQSTFITYLLFTQCTIFLLTAKLIL